MEEADLLRRLSDLEREVKALKAHPKVGETRKPWVRKMQSGARFLKSNWVLVSAGVALIIASYVNFKYHVGYLESYKNTYLTNRVSEFYKDMGDRMMASSEWPAAEQAYRAALQLNPNNLDATYGVVKAQVFQPMQGERYFAPEVVDEKLNYLDHLLPNDEQVYFLKSLRQSEMENYKGAESELTECVSRYPKSFVCFIALGSVHQSQFRISEAVADFSKAVRLKPKSAIARNDLGFGLILWQRFPAATEELDTSYRLSPSMVTGINLGDAYRYSRRFDLARIVHQLVLDHVEKEGGATSDRYVKGDWLYNFMPLHSGDVQTIKSLLRVNSLEQKRAIAHFALSIDLALLEDFGKATEEFDAALKLERRSDYGEFFKNKMCSVENLLQPHDKVRGWLKRHRMSLAVNHASIC